MEMGLVMADKQLCIECGSREILVNETRVYCRECGNYESLE